MKESIKRVAKRHLEASNQIRKKIETKMSNKYDEPENMHMRSRYGRKSTKWKYGFWLFWEIYRQEGKKVPPVFHHPFKASNPDRAYVMKKLRQHAQFALEAGLDGKDFDYIDGYARAADIYENAVAMESKKQNDPYG